MVVSEKITKAFTSIFAPKEEKPSIVEEGVDLLEKEGRLVSENRLVIEQMQTSAESFYFWMLNFLRDPQTLGYNVEKISDVYSATESSSYFGNIEARKSFQQERASGYLATIGSMTKSMFQMIRELRMMDERLDYYEKSTAKRQKSESEDKLWERHESAEIALKGIWVDLVEGGPESATSVFGLARKVGYVILPDLFFKVNPMDGSKGIDREVNKLKEEGINERVRSVLKNKLFQYYTWKERTHKELQVRKRFVLKAFNQHYQTIKMYMHWLKPYLRHITRLEMAELNVPELVTAFESTKIEVVLVASRKSYEVETDLGYVKRDYKKYIPVIRVKFSFSTLPEMAFQKEYQHRGAVHAGRTEITIQSFVVDKESFEDYKKKKETEDLEILAAVSSSIDELRLEMEEYLKEAGALAEKEEAKKAGPEQKGILDPFISIFSGFKEIFSFGGGKKKEAGWDIEQERVAAAAALKAHVFALYDVFKKAHGMLNL